MFSQLCRHEAKYDIYVQDFLIGGLSEVLSATKRRESEPRIPPSNTYITLAESDEEESNLVIDEAEEPEMMDVEPDINIIEDGDEGWDEDECGGGEYEDGGGGYEAEGGEYGGIWAEGADESMFTDNPMLMCQVQCQVLNLNKKKSFCYIKSCVFPRKCK